MEGEDEEKDGKSKNCLNNLRNVLFLNFKVKTFNLKEKVGT